VGEQKVDTSTEHCARLARNLENYPNGISNIAAKIIIALAAERDALQAQLGEMESPCDSCGASLGFTREESTCRGCGKVICIECVTAFDHWGDGEHGTGNPSDYLLSLRAQLREAQERVRELEDRYADMEDGAADGVTVRDVYEQRITQLQERVRELDRQLGEEQAGNDELRHLDKLRIAELERENAELTESVEALSRGFADLNDACVRLECENAALREDKERLDWLERQDADDIDYGNTHKWRVYAEEIGSGSFEADNLREAIDAARERSK